MNKLTEYLLNIEVEYVATVILAISFFTTFILIPKLLRIIHFKNLMDDPDERSSHFIKTPTLGGVAFFISIIFSFFFIELFGYNGYSLNIIVGVMILFFVGLKDDLMVLSAKLKLIAQLFASSFVLIIPELWIPGFSGFLGIGEISLIFSLLIGFFIMIFVVNAYNLIDGIDGLAGLLGLVILTIFGTLFYFSANYYYFLISVVGIGFLIGFLRYNLSKRQRIFMGDTGSLIVGFLIGILTIRFLSLSDFMFQKIYIEPQFKFLIALSVTFFPAVDVARVIMMRLLNNKSPFKPDRSHMHHILIDRNLSHKKASITLSICGLIIFSIMYGLNLFMNDWQMIVSFVMLYIMTFAILLLLDYDDNAKLYRKEFKALFPRRFQKIEFKTRKIIINFLKNLFYKDLL